MNIDEILAKHREKGLKHKPKKFIDLRVEGANVFGKVLNVTEKTTEIGTSLLYEFEVKTGQAKVFSSDKSDELVELKEGEKVFFYGSALLDLNLKDHIGEDVSIIYKGLEDYKKGKKKFKSHRFIVITSDEAEDEE